MNHEQQVLEDVRRALAEDVGSGDVTAALLPPACRVRAVILTREQMVLCGRDWVDVVCAAVDTGISIDWHVREGGLVEAGNALCTIHGPARSILTAERTALNFLQTLSGTATLTQQAVRALDGTGVRVLDTRKTLPGLRYAQKYAVRCGGGTNHRFGLYDAFLIKENHIRALGSVTAAIEAARKLRSDLMVEAEVETLVEFDEALRALPDRILLDNFSRPMLAEAVRRRGDIPCELEASGGVTLDNLAEIAHSGVDFISMGGLTKSVNAIDLSLLVQDAP